MDIEKVLHDINERKEVIETKYSNLIGKLDGLKKELSDIPVKYAKRTKQFQKEKQQQLEKKITDATAAIENWKDEQLKKIEDWLVAKQNQILDDVKKKESDMIERRNSFKLSKENNTNQ